MLGSKRSFVSCCFQYRKEDPSVFRKASSIGVHPFPLLLHVLLRSQGEKFELQQANAGSIPPADSSDCEGCQPFFSVIPKGRWWYVVHYW